VLLRSYFLSSGVCYFLSLFSLLCIAPFFVLTEATEEKKNLTKNMEPSIKQVDLSYGWGSAKSSIELESSVCGV